jgi:hemerythrin-like metal-binding protein
MEWKESYSVGVPVLDADHRILIAIINRLDEVTATGQSVKSVLNELEGYARNHFEREEVRMKAAQYPGLAEHVKEHEAFMEWLRSVISAYDATPDAEVEVARTVAGYLRTWWDDHILTTDKAYRDALS